MNSIKVEILADVPFEQIHASWVRAFSDYQVAISLTVPMLRSFLHQNSVAFDASVGAFDGGELVGFWFNGLREIDGVNVAYDSGTAVWPEYRSRGISKQLAVASNEILRSRGVSEYWLEVIATNEKAYRLYLKDGFVVSRRLCCLKTETPIFAEKEAVSDVRWEEGDFNPDIVPGLPAMEYIPTWQNMTISMTNIREAVRMVVARRDDTIVGYGFIQPARGRISQIGVHPGFWDTPVAPKVLQRLCAVSGSKEIAVINVDAGADKTTALFKRHGFVNFVDQYEMKKSM